MNCCSSDKNQDPRKAALCKRIDAIGWALFFIMIGILLLLPEGRVPETAWLLGAGIILLGGNVVRRLNGIKVDGVTAVLGILALGFGISGFFGVELPIFAILLILFGASIILKPLIASFSGKR
ncbi:MAG: hypothetical protein HQ579_04845 [Candidatus Omnitrophica bacterium]|nr:hypothetical protein [Candidatus Omnitrophota bacterium]